MLKVHPTDIIDIRTWEEFGFPEYIDGAIPNSEIIYCNIQHVDKLFKQCYKEPNKRFKLVSGNSDFGLVYQSQYPVEKDTVEWLYMYYKTFGYNDVQAKTRCNVNRCERSDLYSVKCRYWTEFTFNEIPPNIIRWYCTNSYVNEAIPLPFGISDSSKNKFIEFAQSVKSPTIDKVYVNFQNYTHERWFMKEWLSNQKWAETRIQSNLPFDGFLNELGAHKYILCPPGNGFDSYRFWECIYLGLIPIIIHPFHLQFTLPVQHFDHYKCIEEKKLGQNITTVSLEHATKTFWKNHLIA